MTNILFMSLFSVLTYVGYLCMYKTNALPTSRKESKSHLVLGNIVRILTLWSAGITLYFFVLTILETT